MTQKHLSRVLSSHTRNNTPIQAQDKKWKARTRFSYGNAKRMLVWTTDNHTTVRNDCVVDNWRTLMRLRWSFLIRGIGRHFSLVGWELVPSDHWIFLEDLFGGGEKGGEELIGEIYSRPWLRRERKLSRDDIQMSQRQWKNSLVTNQEWIVLKSHYFSKVMFATTF